VFEQEYGQFGVTLFNANARGRDGNPAKAAASWSSKALCDFADALFELRPLLSALILP
jgi:hypothetical protein